MSTTARTTATAVPETASRCSRPRAAAILVLGVAVAVAINAIVAAVAISAGAPTSFGGLTIPAYVSMTSVGMIAGWIGWRLVVRHAGDPRKTLTILVPVVLLLSFIPDVLLATLQFMPGATATAIVALVIMHVVTAAVAVPTYVIASKPARSHR